MWNVRSCQIMPLLCSMVSRSLQVPVLSLTHKALRSGLPLFLRCLLLPFSSFMFSADKLILLFPPQSLCICCVLCLSLFFPGCLHGWLSHLLQVFNVNFSLRISLTSLFKTLLPQHSLSSLSLFFSIGLINIIILFTCLFIVVIFYFMKTGFFVFQFTALGLAQCLAHTRQIQCQFFLT